jgi:Zn finger protein HypA/HybF involved in hydrogenase expression
MEFASMIIETQAIELAPEVMDVATKLEILCPACNRDVDTAELAAQKCNDCGADLSDPKQHVAVAVTSVPVIGITW